MSSGVREIQPLEQKCLLSGSSVTQFDEALQPFIITDSSGNIQYNALGSQDLSSLSPEQQQQLLYGPWQSDSSWLLSPPVDGDLNSGTMGIDSYDDVGDYGFGADYGVDHTEGGGGIIPVDGDTMGDDYGYDIFGDADMPLPDGGTDSGDDVGADTGAGVDGPGGDPEVEVQIKDLQQGFREGPYFHRKLDRARLRFERTNLGDDQMIEGATVTLKFTGKAKLGADYGIADSTGGPMALMMGMNGTVRLELNDTTGIDTFFLVSRMDGDYELNETVIVSIVGVSANATVGTTVTANSELWDFTGDLDLHNYDEDKEDDPGIDLQLNNDDDNQNERPDLSENPVDLSDNDILDLQISPKLIFANDSSPEQVRENQPNSPTTSFFVLSFDPRFVRIYRPGGELVQSGITRFSDKDVTSLKVEGVGKVVDQEIVLRWIAEYTEGGTAAVHDFDKVRYSVWDVDVDIDSDNDQGFNYPANSDREEFFEDHTHALGKFLYPNDTHFTPVRVRLPAGIDPDKVKLRLEFDPTGESGALKVWNKPKKDPRNDGPVINGGNRIYPGLHDLRHLQYDAGTGALTLWLDAVQVYNNHWSKNDVYPGNKPDDRLKGVLVRDAAELDKDEVKYLILERDSFYDNLQSKRQIRSAMAAEAVYASNFGGADRPEFALQALNAVDLQKLGVPADVAAELDLDSITAPGLNMVLYRDFVTDGYVLAVAGTDFSDVNDIVADIWQGLGIPNQQYTVAMEVGFKLSRLPTIRGRLMVTGHSLGGGLASAVAVTSAIPSDTFNAAGLHRDTIEDVQNLYPGSLQRFEQNGGVDQNGNHLIQARYLDWDILSFIQDHTPLAKAIGHRIEMDGPVDSEMAFAGFTALAGLVEAYYTGGVSWYLFRQSIADALVYMGNSHTTAYYHYGLLVRELGSGLFDGDVVWDIYEFSLE